MSSQTTLKQVFPFQTSLARICGSKTMGTEEAGEMRALLQAAEGAVEALTVEEALMEEASEVKDAAKDIMISEEIMTEEPEDSQETTTADSVWAEENLEASAIITIKEEEKKIDLSAATQNRAATLQ